jgi:hypothetical protein
MREKATIMSPLLRLRLACLLATLLAAPALARADEPVPVPTSNAPVAPPPPTDGPAAAARAPGQGVAVVSAGGPRDEAGNVARAVYASRLRPTSLDEARARVLAGEPPPPDAPRDVRDLAEVRGAIHGEDAASRRLLSGIAQQLGVQALLVVSTEAPPPAVPVTMTPPSTEDAGAPSPEPVAPVAPVNVRLFLAETGDFDAARYVAEPGASGPNAWRATVASLERRFALTGPPAATRPPPPPRSQEGESKPFYASPWFWGAIGAAVLVGGGFYLASRDTSDQPIHLQMHVPR